MPGTPGNGFCKNIKRNRSDESEDSASLGQFHISSQSSSSTRHILPTRPPSCQPSTRNDSASKTSVIDLTLSDSDEAPSRKQQKSTVRTSSFQVVVPSRASLYAAREEAHREFRSKLQQLKGPPVTFSNDIDETTPPRNFKFIDEYEFSSGTHRLGKEFQSGCDCRPDNGRQMGCEYLYCECLEDAVKDEFGNPRGFPYYATAPRKGCLREFYLNSRNPIYECNELCTCLDNCKNKVVQKGRQIPLEIFKTRNRGFGLRSPVDIRKGQFIDTYRGEIITDAEATLRENRANRGKDSYLYSLDKFRGEEGDLDFIPDEDLYVVDGEFMGGPTRFLNHSCRPNCRQFTVSLHHSDSKVYELPFFALEDIPAGSELTFNYTDDDEDSPISDEEARRLTREKGHEPVRCLCSERNCRRYLWL